MCKHNCRIVETDTIMQGARPFVMYLQMSRCISSSSMYANVRREGKFMNKLVHGSHKSKRKWYDISTQLSGIASINLTHKSPSMHTKRRMIICDKLFMQHITDLMSMGEVSDILKEGIEITDVKITQDFKYVNVFYIPNNNDTTVDQEALQKCARIIRRELSELRVIGLVPPIQFVEDKKYYWQNEVDRRLEVINFKEDNEILSEQMQVDMFDVSGVDQTLHKEPVANSNLETDEFYSELPIMRHNVLGLDHQKIMSRITSTVSKSKKAVQRRMLNVDTSTDKSSHDPVSKEVSEFITVEEQRKIFSEFLKKRSKECRLIAKQSGKQKLLNNFEEEANNEEYNYNDDIDINEEYIDDDIDDFQNETRK